ncbi:riboflavin synthase subunit beta [Pontimicrobium sp. IMCC45349]|uniref:riboflavin synthase subunit beta n=1 Tax=Pontimicrobium sp. IMCC45349 TaxID=3391574 RepID=UPI0039A079C2
MGILKTRKNKKYDYKPRFYKGEGSPYEIKHKFDDNRKTIGNPGLKGKFNNAIEDYKENPNEEANRRVLIVIAVLVLIFLFIIDFDLTIFFS